MGLEALGLPADISRVVAGWSVDAVNAIQTGIGKVRTAISTYTQVKAAGGTTGMAVYSALAAAGLDPDIATTIGNWTALAEAELIKLIPKLQKAIKDGQAGSTVGLWELIGLDNDVATKIDIEIKRAAKDISTGITGRFAEVEAIRKMERGELSMYDALIQAGADPNKPAMQAMRAYATLDTELKKLPPEAQVFAPPGQAHPLWGRMGLGPPSPAPDLAGAADFAEARRLAEQRALLQQNVTPPDFAGPQRALTDALSGIHDPLAGANVELERLDQHGRHAADAMASLAAQTGPAAAAMATVPPTTDPAATSLGNVATSGTNAALGLGAVNEAAGTTDLSNAANQAATLGTSLDSVSSKAWAAAAALRGTGEAARSIEVPTALVQQSPSAMEQALMDAGEAGYGFARAIMYAGRGMAGASRAVAMGQAEWEDFGITLEETKKAATPWRDEDERARAIAGMGGTAAAFGLATGRAGERFGPGALSRSGA